MVLVPRNADARAWGRAVHNSLGIAGEHDAGASGVAQIADRDFRDDAVSGLREGEPYAVRIPPRRGDAVLHAGLAVAGPVAAGDRRSERGSVGYHLVGNREYGGRAVDESRQGRPSG